MIDRILEGTTTDDDLETARSYSYDDRKKLTDRLIGSLSSTFEETLLLEQAVEDVALGLKQARPVFAAGLSVDQALGFIVKMVDVSMSDLADAGEQDSEEYEKQELVKDMLEGFIDSCNEAGTTEGEEAYETVHFEYRGEVGKLEALKTKSEAGIANSLKFVKECYGEGNELAAYIKGFDTNMFAARFIGTFGSPSFFAYKHVAAPGETFATGSAETEGD